MDEWPPDTLDNGIAEDDDRRPDLRGPRTGERFDDVVGEAPERPQAPGWDGDHH